MANGQVDPASLEGEALMRWYRRTPQEIDDEQRRAAADAYNRFFYPAQFNQSLGSNNTMSDNQDPAANDGQGQSGDDDAQVDPLPDDDIASPTTSPMDGPSGFPSAPGFGLLGDWRRDVASVPGDQNSAAGSEQRSTDQGDGRSYSGPDGNARSGSPTFDTTLATPRNPSDGFPENPASPEEADLIQVGNPHNPRLRRQWQKANGQPWPKTDDGRNYDVAHKRAIADGGTNTLDNIEPMHPDEHAAQHLNNGDSARWGLRSSIARAFGGTVEPPTSGRGLQGLGLLGFVPWITGLLSGNIRTDTPEHTWYDMAGFPAPDDNEKLVDPACRARGINTPGGKCI